MRMVPFHRLIGQARPQSDPLPHPWPVPPGGIAEDHASADNRNNSRWTMGDWQTSPAGLRQAGVSRKVRSFRTDTALRHIPAIKRTRQIALPRAVVRPRFTA